MKYSPKYFKNNLPRWKWKKDPVLSKLFYRPVSFLTASICANLNISANTVSYFSALLAAAASACFLFNSRSAAITGAVLVNVWLILDCTDGNLARSVKSQPMGEFADSISSYILVAFLFNAMGYYVYRKGGMFISSGCGIALIAGMFASSFDTLSRLIYQKFNAVKNDYYGSKGIKTDEGQSESKINKLRIRIDSELGLGGILPIAVLLGTVFDLLDAVLILWSAYYGALFVGSLMYHIFKAVSIAKTGE
ncbi:MAG: CDP-alcohol phosphatidyltransferase family protein [Oscillospiraceae bacterium]|nr:CDP-alcohol phosphatidyltransferase family protein [Oscillospiraceae bacterium]